MCTHAAYIPSPKQPWSSFGTTSSKDTCTHMDAYTVLPITYKTIGIKAEDNKCQKLAEGEIRNYKTLQGLASYPSV